MKYSSSLADDQFPLVLDTSVLINLHASRCGEGIISSLPNKVLVPGNVALELEHETSRSNGDHQFIRNLSAACKVEIVSLTETEYEIFGTLVSGTPSLDDGEAATIAIAVCRNCLPVIDERKGRQLAKVHIHDKQPGWSLDLFRHPHTVEKLGSDLSVEALYFALRDGRMRIHEEHCDYVVSLLGLPRALDCNSLPGYKARRKKWLEGIS